MLLDPSLSGAREAAGNLCRRNAVCSPARPQPAQNSFARPMHPSKWFDHIAIALSGICIVHCLALPVLVALLPVLALSWEVREPTVWRFKLRPNVTFHNGAPFNADAVVAAITWLKGDAGKATVVGQALGVVAGAAGAVSAATAASLAWISTSFLSSARPRSAMNRPKAVSISDFQESLATTPCVKEPTTVLLAQSSMADCR